MTQTISAIDMAEPGQGKPWLRIVLTCEGNHGLLDAPTWAKTAPDYMAIRAEAAAAGWKRAHGGIWLCPACAR